MEETTFNRIRLLIATAVLALFCMGAFAQTIDSLVVLPENPTTSDEVSVHIYGWLWSSDVYIANIDVNTGSYLFNIDLDCQATGVGLPVLVQFDTVVSLGMLPAYPNWNVIVNTFLGGNQQETMSVQFAVSDPTGINPSFGPNEPSNYPNPFTDRTTFRFTVERTEKVELVVYNILGVEQAVVVSNRLPAGEYHFPLDTRYFSPGKYFYQLRVGSDLTTHQIYRTNR